MGVDMFQSQRAGAGGDPCTLQHIDHLQGKTGFASLGPPSRGGNGGCTPGAGKSGQQPRAACVQNSFGSGVLGLICRIAKHGGVAAHGKAVDLIATLLERRDLTANEAV